MVILYVVDAITDITVHITAKGTHGSLKRSGHLELPEIEMILNGDICSFPCLAQQLDLRKPII